MNSFTLAAKATEVPDPGRITVVVDDRVLVLIHAGGQFFAIDDVCTHDGGGLAGGEVQDHQVICPRHGARFCLRTGQALTPPAYEPVRSYPTRVVDGNVEVAAEP